MRTTSIKLPPSLDRMLTELARRLRLSRSAVVRKALEAFVDPGKDSVTARAGDLVGAWRGPEDLSSDPRHLAGYGR